MTEAQAEHKRSTSGAQAEHKRSWLSVLAGLSCGALLSSQVPACGTSSAPDEDCKDCVGPGEFNYACYGGLNHTRYKGSVCSTATNPESVCAASYSSLAGFDAVQVWCDGEGDTGVPSCASYTPGLYVTLTSGVYHVQADFIEDLIADPSPALECDSARLAPQSAGKYKVTGATTSSLLYKLGLRNNDVPQSINGKPLEDLTDGAQAFGELYLAGATTYALVVKRGTSTLTLYYVIDP